MQFFKKIKLIFEDESLRKRILFVLGALLVFRFLANVPIPGVNESALYNFLNQSNFFGLINMFSGGGLSNLSIALLGVGPYITAAIIMQLLTVLSPKIKAMYHEEGEAGRMKFAQYSRYLTVLFAAIQGFAFLMLFVKQGIVSFENNVELAAAFLTIIAGSVLLMWIGELVTEFGIGNGVSLIIFAGIVAGLLPSIAQALIAFDTAMLPMYIALAALTVFVTAAVVFITEAERRIKITHSRQARAGRFASRLDSYLPLKVNQAGVIPIIFAISIMLFPQMIIAFASQAGFGWAQAVAPKIDALMANQWIYSFAYAVLVFIFTYFYTAITFEPKKIAENLQRTGAFIPEVRPGEQTVEYLANVVTRITLFGALFLAIIAVLPVVVQAAVGMSTFAIGGAALLIVVSVVLDVLKRIDAQLSVRGY